jgi:hypothetical protein
MKQSAMPVLVRHLVYASRTSSSHICVCAARDRRHALQIARQTVPLQRTAYALPEPKLPKVVHA